MKKYIAIILGILLTACSSEPKFTEKVIEHTNENCMDNCLSVTINYLVCKKPTAFADFFNREIEEQVINFLLSNQIDSLATNVSSVSEAVKLFVDDYNKLHQHFPDIPAFELNLSDSISFQNKKIISLVSDRYAYTGGAHELLTTIFLNFDIETKTLIANENLFSDIEKVSEIAEIHFNEQRKIVSATNPTENDFWFDDNKFTFPENIGFTKEYLILLYNPYEIASYVNGAFQVKIPIEEVKPYLNIGDL